MSLHDLSIIILISLLIVWLPAFGLSKLFPKAGIESWKAWVPFLNTWEIVKTAGIRKHWFFWQFIPIVGWFISMWLMVEWSKLFGKFGFFQHAAAALVPFIYFPIMGADQKERFIGKEQVKKHKKSAAREWLDAGVFAVVAATLIRTFVFEAYTIPTGSMEKTLLINDFLFVSKLTYGPRIPNTPLAIPFVHHTLPVINTKSYTEVVHLPYRRWFGKPVKRNDVVVFNFPFGDTLTKEYDSQTPYYDILESVEMQKWEEMKGQYKDSAQALAASRLAARNYVWDNFTIVTRPVDKRENYIKRCVGIAGDTIQIKNGTLFVNGKEAFLSPTAATDYIMNVNDKVGDRESLISVLRENGVRINDDISSGDLAPTGLPGQYNINLTKTEFEIVKKLPFVVAINQNIESDYNSLRLIFPRDSTVARWTIDQFGPLWIPKKGVTIPLTKANVAIYKRAIKVYENNDWEERDGKIFINGQEANSYTFKMDYFWMMGDNRHRSQDSRFWGFVPEDHVVGGAWLIWMSWEKGVRWNRLFRTIH